MDKRKEQTGMFSLQMSACNCAANLNKDWQQEEGKWKNSVLCRLGSCFLNLKIIQLVNSVKPAGKWWTGCFAVMCRTVHILSCLKYRQKAPGGAQNINLFNFFVCISWEKSHKCSIHRDEALGKRAKGCWSICETSPEVVFPWRIFRYSSCLQETCQRGWINAKGQSTQSQLQAKKFY